MTVFLALACQAKTCGSLGLDVSTYDLQPHVAKKEEKKMEKKEKRRPKIRRERTQDKKRRENKFEA